MITLQEFKKLKNETLQHFWGYQHFRDLQDEITDSIASGKDTLALLPTGGGKSLCYQLPALIMEGTCMVVSPLIALMKDQVMQLKFRNIEAEYLSAELDEAEAEEIYSRCREGITKLLYVSPERLASPAFLEHLLDIQLSFIAVDEAHCISEWGQDFRPGYQNIKTFRNDHPELACLALTATATPKVLSEIIAKLELKTPAVFKKSFQRDNIRIFSETISDKYQWVYDLLRYHQGSGIIYTKTRKEAEELAQFLKNRDKSRVDFFHAGLSAREKHQKQQRWTAGENEVLVSTNAFGMGIDKENVRFIIHFSAPASLENYYQEIGRAGRDGKESFAFMIWNEQEFLQFDQILKNQIPDKKEYLKIISHLYSIFQIADSERPERAHQLFLHHLQNTTKCSAAKIKNVLNFLHNQELIFLNNHKSLSSLELKLEPHEIELLPKKDAYFIELLLRSIPGISTHKVMFSEQNLSGKIGAEMPLIKERIRELRESGHLEYIDGALSSITFIKPRDDRSFHGKYWHLFEQIQKNKIRKWEEMKFFAANKDHCRMKMILTYFGEKNTGNCRTCDVCETKKSRSSTSISEEIIKILTAQPATADEIFMQLAYCKKEKILEHIILLLDIGKIKMLNFRTYTLA